MMMSEKRFTLAYEQGGWWAVRDGDITLWKEEVIYLLNKLYGENEQLRKELNDCEKFRYQVFERMEALNNE